MSSCSMLQSHLMLAVNSFIKSYAWIILSLSVIVVYLLVSIIFIFLSTKVRIIVQLSNNCIIIFIMLTIFNIYVRAYDLRARARYLEYYSPISKHCLLLIIKILLCFSYWFRFRAAYCAHSART